MKRHIKKVAIGILAAFAVCYGVLCIYSADYYHADQNALDALQSNNTVTVITDDDMVLFRPENAKAGFIFYPGGKVEYTAYAPLMQKLAQNNIACVITKMPFNLAVMDVTAADKAVELLGDIDNLYIGGHSLGGSMAASYIDKAKYDLDGLVMVAAYSTADLTDNDINVLLVSASNDGVINHEKETKYMDNLPASSWGYHITGGNHAQFGSYGPQKGDGIATVSAQEQLELAADAIISFIIQEEPFYKN